MLPQFQQVFKNIFLKNTLQSFPNILVPIVNHRTLIVLDDVYSYWFVKFLNSLQWSGPYTKIIKFDEMMKLLQKEGIL